jgi:hypothetical protein
MDTPLRLNELDHNGSYWPEPDMPKNAIDVAIGGKADMAYCSANVRL